MIVMKFGGTSLQGANAMRRVLLTSDPPSQKPTGGGFRDVGGHRCIDPLRGDISSRP